MITQALIVFVKFSDTVTTSNLINPFSHDLFIVMKWPSSFTYGNDMTMTCALFTREFMQEEGSIRNTYL